MLYGQNGEMSIGMVLGDPIATERTALRAALFYVRLLSDRLIALEKEVSQES